MDIWGAFSDGNEPRNSPNVLSLFNSASRNQLEKVNSILAKNSTLKIDEDVNGFNCFHIAAKKGHIDVIKRLHELYPDLVNTRTSDNQRSPLMLAAFEGNEILAEYLSQFELTSVVDASGNNALHYACWGGHFELAKYLIEKKQFDPSVKNVEGLNAIQFAAAGKHLMIVQYLTKFEGNLAVELSDSGYNSLHRAAISGSFETVKFLLLSSTAGQHGVPINSKAHNGNTALHLTAQHGSLDIIQYLIDEKAEVNVQNDYDLTPLHFACIGGHLNIVRYLVLHGASIHIRNSSGSTALHLAAGSGKHDICAYLAEQPKIDLMALDSEGHSAIDAALSAGYKEIASRLAFWSCIELRSKKLLLLIDPQMQ
mmetsp:Transcript_1052/g.1172  ORF Transcript_1052/g.1172 Transcript_1052/m.1172 type:complete len:368 (+) Transcript_1052:177-1280(+)